MENLMQEFIDQQIRDSYDVKKSILADRKLCETILDVALKCVDIYEKGKKTLIAGNGGSAADAQHIAGEFVSKFYFDRPPLSSIALTTDTSILTAIGNDYGYGTIFSRQIEANGNEGDLFIGISTSARSPNIVAALKRCKEKGISTVGLMGAEGGGMLDLCDYSIMVPSKETPRIQEAHILIGHIICAVVEEKVFGEKFQWKQ